MRVKPKETMIIRYGAVGKCYIRFSCNQIYEVTDHEDAQYVVLSRDNVSAQILRSDLKTRFREVKPRELEVTK